MSIYYKGAFLPPVGAQTAKQIYAAGYSVGDGLYWLTDPNGKSFQAYCDMTTPDENGERGWMLVASWSTYDWSVTSTSSKATFSTTALNTVSSNFGDYVINQFRVHSAPSITSTATNAASDWYYNYSVSTRWKEVWAPDGTRTQYYRSAGTNPAIPRCSLKRFDWSYNLKGAYKNAEHKYQNISDYGYDGVDSGSPYVGSGLFNTQTTGLNYTIGYAKFWDALTKSGKKWSVYDMSYNADWETAAGPTSDGSLAIPISGSGTDTSGQDYDTNISAKIGRDDNTTWTTGFNGNLWWWIK